MPDNPYKPPRDVEPSRVEEEKPGLRPDQAGDFGPRACAAVLDLAWFKAVMAGSFLLACFMLRFVSVGSSAVTLERLENATSSGVSVVAFLTYFVVAESLGGASLGKMMFGLRVVGRDFRPAGPSAILIRRLAFFVDSLLFGWPAYASMTNWPYKQRYGDRWAGTYVFRREALPPISVRGSSDVARGIFAGTAVAGAMHVADFFLHMV
jgi:uncharacterized RDD family membrane protein YckC